MNIFISWSGNSSMKIAEELKNWLPKILQSAKPYYTPSDIEKGTRWDSEISIKLSECLIGLICLTKLNTEKPWILFEAGALSNRLEKAKVCPILFGVKKSEVTGPLSRFQLTEFNKEDFYKLVISINSSLEENSIDDSILLEVFETFYPKFEAKILEILADENSYNEIPKPERSERDILDEILELVRKQDNANIFVSQHLSNDFYSHLPVIESDIELLSGDLVYHERFGVGKVHTFYPDNLNPKAAIDFAKEGRKTLILKFAKLRKL